MYGGRAKLLHIGGGFTDTKEELLKLFEENKGVYISGEDIAEKLSVSRTAVWKAVKSLRLDGYKIDSVQNKGYSLATETDILSAQGIYKYLKPAYSGLQIKVFPIVGSTNTCVREMAEAGAAEGSTVISGAQTGGRGRNGHSFFSPYDTGLYMSVLLRPQGCRSDRAVRLTTMAAVAVCEAIEAVSGQKARIKWVNDIFIDSKKVCGILTEASFGLENGLLEYAVVGIGINVFTPEGGFPKELKNIAGAVFNKKRDDAKNLLAAECLNSFMKYYTNFEKDDYVNEYRRRSLVIGKNVSVMFSDGKKEAVVLDIDDDCRLIVQYADGTTEGLFSGEVSVKV